jgi:undecaprenyl-diphosphatase
VGWSRVYLGVHFPFDILAAFPVALCGVVIVHALRRTLFRPETMILTLYDEFASWLSARVASHKA